MENSKRVYGVLESKTNPLDDNLQNEVTAFHCEAQRKLREGFPLDALAFIDGIILQYGEKAVTQELLEDRARAIQAVGRQPDYPMPRCIGLGKGATPMSPCDICGDQLRSYEYYHDKEWLVCPTCGLLQYKLGMDLATNLGKGEADGAKQPPESLVHTREGYFCELFLNGMGWKKALLYGAGWSLIPKRLLDDGFDAVGCDLWIPLIEERKKQLGDDRFYHRDELPNKKWDLISAFEVFEHFITPMQDLKFLADRLEDEGAIVGCTDFWHGGSLSQHPNPDKRYWRHPAHVTAWSFSSMNRVALELDLATSFFKVDKPGWGAKVIFVMHRGRATKKFIQSIPPVICGAF
ncbi:methyltransferase domain-containing protein [Desulfovibrio sp.]|uniref:methyltransferase domain-containing protein n=1 Tax=Desulfovibrio sp. TaxID=885 RepID=UPI0025C4274D|nr:methyltransferase domain-containing protein [Desulfovibrio sp.]